MTADEIIDAVSEVTGLPRNSIVSSRKGEGAPRARMLCALLMRDHLNLTSDCVARYVGLGGPSAVTYLMKRGRKLMEECEFASQHAQVLAKFQGEEKAA